MEPTIVPIVPKDIDLKRSVKIQGICICSAEVCDSTTESHCSWIVFLI